jgi:hypothetical protein
LGLGVPTYSKYNRIINCITKLPHAYYNEYIYIYTMARYSMYRATSTIQITDVPQGIKLAKA